jgi:hypothetical protein
MMSVPYTVEAPEEAFILRVPIANIGLTDHLLSVYHRLANEMAEQKSVDGMSTSEQRVASYLNANSGQL